MNVVVFLRDDIYQDLQFEDKNKITENYTSQTQWSEEDSGLTLRKLMEKRFSTVLSEDGNEVWWSDVFDESKEMPSRQSKYKHICDRTFLHPRDMIKFCNEVLKAHKVQDVKSFTLFDNTSIHSARKVYSEYLLNELDDEIAKHVPRYRDYLEVLKSIGLERFSFSDFVEKWKARNIEPGTPLGALERLFDFSVVGYLKPGGRRGGSEYIWRYRNPRARFDSTVESFRVHPGFKEALGFQERRHKHHR